MADLSDDEPANRKLHQNQPYDESLDVPDSEDVPSENTPTPRIPRGRSRGNTPPKHMDMSDQSEEEDYDSDPNGPPQNMSGAHMAGGGGGGMGGEFERGSRNQIDALPSGTHKPQLMGDVDTGSSEEEETSDSSNPPVEGAYDPADYEHLVVDAETKELFQYIMRYTPQTITLEYRLRPFIPDFIPAVGDIDAFIKIPRVDEKPDTLGLTVLDEPSMQQTDAAVLELQLRALSKDSPGQADIMVKSVTEADKNPKVIDQWIASISELHRSKPPPTVNYTKNMPDIESLMQEWPAEFEELLKDITLPGAELDCELTEYIDLICGLLDIPVYKSRVQSLHVLFSLFLEFKNSQHFRAVGGGTAAVPRKLMAQEDDDDDRLVL